MKKRFLLFLILSTPFLGFSQDYLLDGSLIVLRPAQQQYYYKDLLRYKVDGWLVEERNIGGWIPYEKYISTKYSDLSFHELRYSKWNDFKQTWETKKLLKDEKTYSNGKPKTIIRRTFEDQFKDTGSRTYEYSYENNILKSIEILGDIFGVYGSLSKEVYVYNANDKLFIDSTIITSSNPNWVNTYDEFLYDIKGNAIKTTSFERFNNQFGAFDTGIYFTKDYDAYNRIIKTSGYSHELHSKIFKKTTESIYEYNDFGFIKSALISYYNESLNAITPAYSYKQYYDSTQKLTAFSAFYLWGAELQPIDSVALFYRNDGALDTSFSYTGAFNPFTNKIIWNLRYRYIFDKTNALSMQSIKAAFTTLNAYPNPANQTLFVEFNAATEGNTDVVLMDITGKVLKTQAVQFFAGQTTTTELQIDDLATGIYMLRAGNNTIKIFKQ
jgi:hypothetical protein